MVTAPVRVLVAEETFGEFLETLRGEEKAASVARRMTRLGYDITSSYIGKLERNQVQEPGTGILTTLAEAYRDRWPAGRDALFWELWRRAGYPLPPGYFEANERERAILAGLYRLTPERRAEFEREIREEAEGQEEGQ